MLEKLKIAFVLTVVAGGPDSTVVSGPSTVQLWLAAEASCVPAVLTARTFSSCAPTVRLSMMWCDGQESNVSPSSEHSKLAAGSVEANLKSAVVLIVEAGGASVIVVSGATTVHA